MRHRIKKAFTIIELVIVIAVIGILAAILIPTFVNLTSKANESADASLVRTLNTTLSFAVLDDEDTPNITFKDVLYDLNKYGSIKEESIVSKSNNLILWNQEDNTFYLEKDIDTSNPYKYWMIVKDTIDTSKRYSSYLSSSFASTTITNLVSGLDVGSNDITSITFSGNIDRNKEVRIFTSGGTLNISTPTTGLDINKVTTISHYGNIEKVNITHLGNDIYKELGHDKSLEVKQGKVNIGDNAHIDEINTNNRTGNVNIVSNFGDTVDLIINNEGDTNLEVSDVLQNKVKDIVYVGNALEANYASIEEAYTAGANNILLVSNITTTNEITIARSFNIYGRNNSISNNNKDLKAVFGLNEGASSYTFSIHDLVINAQHENLRGISIRGDDISVNVIDSSIYCNKMACIQNNSGANGTNINVHNSILSSGDALGAHSTIYILGDNGIVNINNSTVSAYASSSRYSTVGAITINDGENYVINIKNTVINLEASSSNVNLYGIYLQSQSSLNEVNSTNLTINKEDNSYSSVTLSSYLDEGTNNTINL